MKYGTIKDLFEENEKSGPPYGYSLSTIRVGFSKLSSLGCIVKTKRGWTLTDLGKEKLNILTKKYHSKSN